MKLDVNDTMLRSFESEKAFTKCPHCGNYAKVDTSMVLTSNPPQYNYYCEHCGHSGYTKCSDVERGGWLEIPKVSNPETLLAAPCLVCGESVPVSILDNHSKICEKCKKAILKVRKMIEDKE